MSPHDYEPVEMRKELQQLAVDAEPPEAHRTAALASLDKVISSESPSDAPALAPVMPIGKKRRRTWILRVSAVAAVAAALFAVVVLPAEEVTSLENFARAIEPISNESLTGAVVERHALFRHINAVPFDIDDPLSEDTVVFLTEERTRRISDDGTWQVEERLVDIEFIMDVPPEAERAIEEDLHLGVTQTWTYPPDEDMIKARNKVSDDPETLERNIRSEIERWPNPDIPDSVEVFREVVGLHVSYILTPTERAATLRVLNGIPELITTTDGTTVTVQAEYEDLNGRETETATFDRDGWLIATSYFFHDGIAELIDEPVMASVSTFEPPVLIYDE